MYYFLLGLCVIVIIIILLISWGLELQGKSIHEVICEEMYGYKFIENRFPPNKNKKEYTNRVCRGYELCKDKTLLVTGLAYNLGKAQSKLLMKRLDYLADCFKRVDVLIYAADSRDDTMKWLREYKKHCSNINKLYLPEEVIDIKGCKRMKKMARLRNNLIKHCRPIKCDYVMMIDCDMVGPTSKDGMVHSIAHIIEDNYAMIGANGLCNASGINVNFNFLGYWFYDPIAYTLENGTNISIHNLFTPDRGDDLIKVRSTFAGAAIYKKEILDKYDYDEQEEICEHKTFNYKAWNDGYKMAVNPSFILLSGRQGRNHHK